MTDVSKELVVSVLLSRIDLARTEAAQSQAQARYYETRIISGAYVDRLGKVTHGCGPQERAFTLDELKDDEFRTLRQHIKNAEESIDYAKNLLVEVNRLLGGQECHWR